MSLVFEPIKISVERKQPNMLATTIATDHEFDGALNELADFSASIHWFFAEIHICCFRPSKPSVKKVVTIGNRKQMRFPKLPCFNTTSQIQVISDRSIRLKGYGRFLCFPINVSRANSATKCEYDSSRDIF